MYSPVVLSCGIISSVLWYNMYSPVVLSCGIISSVLWYNMYSLVVLSYDVQSYGIICTVLLYCLMV